jgi:autotransporter-associated beta strand protein
MSNSTLPLALSAGLALTSLGSLQAQTFTWTQALSGNTTVNWASGSWSPSAPTGGSGQIAAFDITGSSGTLTVNSIPDITLGGISSTTTTSRPITFNGGLITLQVGSGSPTLDYNNTGGASALIINNLLAGTQGFTKTGTGRLQINGNNTGLSGAVSLNQGAVVAGNDGAFGSGSVTLNGSTLNTSSGTRTFANNFIWNSGSFGNDGGNSNAVAIINGTLLLNGTSGNLASYNPNAASNPTQGTVFNGVVSGGVSGNSFTLQNQNGPTGNMFTTFSVANSFAHNISLGQGGTTQVGGRLGTSALLVGHNQALSSATVTVGAHRFAIASTDGNARALANNFVFTTNNAGSGNAPLFQFTLGQATLQTVGGGTLGGTGNIAIGNLDIAASTGAVAAIARRISVEGSTVGTINGVFSRSGTLAVADMTITKTGTGTLILANSGNTYDGAFAVAAGTLLVNGNLGGTGLTVGAGARLGGIGTITAATTVNSGGTLAPGNSPGVLNFTGPLTLAGNAAFELDGTARGTGYDGINTGAGLLTYGGTLDLSFGSAFLSGNTTFDLFQIGGGGQTGTFSSVASTSFYEFTLNSGNSFSATDQLGNTWSFNHGTGDLSFTAVPEPSSYAIFAGLAGLGLASLRRRR